MATAKPTNFTVNLADRLNMLEQIKIAERHVATGATSNLDGTPLSQLLPSGLRTVNGSDNNLLPRQSLVGSADQVMPRLLTPVFLNDGDGDQMAFGPPGSGAPVVTNTNYALQGTVPNGQGVATGSVADADPRIISNLISDQTVGNFAAVFKALELAGSINPFADTQAILDAFAAAKADLTVVVALQAGGALPGNPALVAAQTAAALAATTAANLPVALGLDISPNGSITILNQSPDIGLSPPFNGWMTMFGQFFDHGLDLIPKGGNGTVYIPLQPDDPLYVVGGPNFMALTRTATVTTAGADGRMGTLDDQTHETINTTTPFIDQNQTYTSNASHQAFLREYRMVDGKPANTGHLLDGTNGGIANWGEIKLQAREKLGALNLP